MTRNSLDVYYVSYCVLNQDAGANPFGHSCLIFSKTNDQGRIQVEKIYGYYSQASTTTKPLMKWLKFILGVKYDLQATHAVLSEEKMRELVGDGLKGLSFSITPTQYQDCLAQMQEKMRIQDEEMQALNTELIENGMLPSGSARYKLQTEKTDLPAERRLPPFHLCLDRRLSTYGSVTCKQLALNFLQDHKIIEKSLREQLECKPSFRHAFPRYAEVELAPIRLQATGPYHKEQSRSGRIYFNPRQDRGNQLFWIVPPDLTREPTSIAQIKALDERLKPLMQTYRLLLKELYLLNSQAAQVVLAHMHQIAESLALQTEELEPKLRKLKELMDYAKSVIDPNYYHVSFLRRLGSDTPLMLSGLSLLALSSALILSLSSIAPEIAFGLLATLTLNIILLAQASLNFMTREQAFQEAKLNYLAHSLNATPCLA